MVNSRFSSDSYIIWGNPIALQDALKLYSSWIQQHYWKGVSEYTFPYYINNKWTNQVRRTRYCWIGSTVNSVLCNEHFTNDCFEERYSLHQSFGLKNNMRLKKGTVATTFKKATKRNICTICSVKRPRPTYLNKPGCSVICQCRWGGSWGQSWHSIVSVWDNGFIVQKSCMSKPKIANNNIMTTSVVRAKYKLSYF